MNLLEGARSCVILFVNGKRVCVENPDPETNLLYFLRNKLHLTGTKLGCAEGGCGTCTVMVSQYDRTEDKVTHMSVNACLAPLCSLDGTAVTTVEGIGSTRTSLHPCQERIARAHGSQCGFCTPGFVMSMYTLLRNNVSPDEKEIEGALDGNLCRCTGYRAILDGFKTFTNSGCCGGGCCCKEKTDQDDTQTIKESSVLFDASQFKPLDPTQDPIFPSELQLADPPPPLARVSWYRPSTLKQLLELRSRFPNEERKDKPQTKLVIGNTEIGIEVKFKGAFYRNFISCSLVPELNEMEVTEGGLCVGSAVTLNRLADQLRQLQIRLPGGQRTIVMDANFFTGYKKTAIRPDEVLVSILIPFTKECEYVFSYKQSRRREDDIAIVNAGLRVALTRSESDWVVEDCCLSYGGMSYVTKIAKKTEMYLYKRPWCESTLEKVYELLLEDLPLLSDAPGGMPEYRRSLVTSFFFKFYLSVCSHLGGKPLPDEDVSATKLFRRDLVKSTQGFQTVPKDQSDEDKVGRPMMHLSALQQATGEARYLDDIPHIQGELYAGLVLSSHTHANITVDYSEAVKMEGVKGYVGVKDVPGSNFIGAASDEVVFADEEVNFIGQVIGLIVAESKPLAQRAAKAVKVTYKDLPAVVTIEDAIAAASFYSITRKIETGDVESALSSSEHRVEGVVHVGGQDHFYLETICCLVLPKGEGGELEIISSTQGLEPTQRSAASALGIPFNRIVVKTKRIGGGFGGKETGSSFLSTVVAVAVNKYQVPIRVMLDRNENMTCAGRRHPFLGSYKVGFTPEGRLTSLNLQLYSNAGYAQDLSIAVFERAMTHSDNAYNIPNFKVEARACRTNLPPNTAFRGFGAPQGMLIVEQWMTHVASYLGMPSEKIQELNMYRDGDATPYGQVQVDCPIRRCWQKLKENYDERKIVADDFNRVNHWKKRGVAITPTKYGIAFGRTFLNQGGALLHVYTDGSVLLTHGGIEMGQGLHTKMVQVCAHCFNIHPDTVFISGTSTDTVPNASPSAASVSTDLYGMAVKDCCDQIMERLKPLMEEDRKAGWNEWVKRAYFRRINLSAQGFYATPRLGFDWEKGRGNLFNYFSYGVSFSEVEVDTLTGDFNVLRTDIVMDVGDSINPAIDIGQVEGAFTQGLGLFTLEQCVYLEGDQRTQRGAPFTTGPGTYKIPSSSDIPVEFNVSLLDRAPNPKAIFSSKAVGEPPLFLAASVFFAIKDAITAARKERGTTGYFRLDAPATCERIRMSCVDQFTKQVCADIDSNAERWTLEV